MDSLKDLYVHELKDIYNAETQIIDALPKMIDAANHDELRNALEEHLEITKRQRERLEDIFDDLEERPTGEKCEGIEGIIQEGEEQLKNKMDSDVLDAALIAAAQRVEHYEIAAYGTVRTFAERLGRDEDADLLQQTLDEEKETDHKLTEIAVRIVNPETV